MSLTSMNEIRTLISETLVKHGMPTRQVFIIDIARMFERLEKAYGGCRKCYGKGYSTVRYGLDFGRSEEKPTTHIETCTCDRGKQLARLLKEKRG